MYENDKECLVNGYSDSNYATVANTRKSVNRYVFTLGDSIPSWKSTLRTLVTLSITEAEYMVLTSIAKEYLAQRSCR